MSVDEVFEVEWSSRNQKILRSVGIDIGSTTSHLIFSKLILEVVEEKHKFEIVNKKIMHISDISLTPYLDPQTIDVEKLSSILYSAYEEAGLSPNEIDTGAVIITGIATLKRNAEKIINLFAEQLGKFVCATAGPNYEAVLAAYGSGAVEQSKKERKTIMNIDVGGGTSKIAIVKDGEIIDIACLYVGARPVVIDDFDKIIRIEEPARIIAKIKSICLEPHKILSKKEQILISKTFAKCLYEIMSRSIISNLTKQLLITPPLSYKGKIDKLTFSGGVSEYIYGYTKKEFGDLGKILGKEIKKISENLNIPISEPIERIRATVIGASQYTLQVSGSTIFLSEPNLLPLRNLPVIPLKFFSKNKSKENIEAEIMKALKVHDITEGEETFAIAFPRSVITNPSYKEMKNFATAICSALKNSIQNNRILVMVFEADIGRGMGRVIKEEVEPNCKLVSIDEIILQDYNYIDIGEEMGDKKFIPVTIKSLVFPSVSK